jgi:tRNA A-37 threonylcarbamoyl transferase component Bud32
MTTRPVVHPSVQILQAFGVGKLDDSAADEVMSHLETCADCRAAVSAQSGDSFLDRLPAARSPGATPTPPRSASGLPRDFGPIAPAQACVSTTAGLPAELVDHPQYEVVRKLGMGGMGVVYLARNKLMDRPEVLKVVNQDLLDQPGSAERFLQEIRSAARLNHPNVVAAYSALRLSQLLVLAMEYVEGEDLAVVVKASAQAGRQLEVANACYYAQQAALGLQHAFEKGMVHRDIKPGNLILSRQGTRHVVKILDFGLAKVARSNRIDGGLTGTGQMMGTPDYIAPEQMLDAAAADIRADIYSLGCTLYYLLTGSPPFKGRSMYEVLQAHHSTEARPLNLARPEVPVELAAVVAKMMAKDPAKRYQKPIEAAQALEPFVGAEAKPALGRFSPEQAVENAKPAPLPADEGKGLPAATPMEEAAKLAPTTQVVPAAAAWQTEAEVGKAPDAPGRRKSRRIGPAAAAGLFLVLLLGLVGLWAAGVFKGKTPDGTIVLENMPPDAEVTVDGGAVPVKSADGKTFEVRVDPRTKHRLEVKKEGFKAFGEEVEFDAGDRKTVVVRLEPEVAQNRPGKPAVEQTPPSTNPAGGSGTPEPKRKAKIGSGTWKAEKDELHQTDARTGNCCIVFGDPDWTDYDYSFEVTKTDGLYGIAALFRATDLKNFMVFDLAGWQNRKYTVECVVKGQPNWVVLDRVGSMAKEKKYRVLVKVRADSFRCYINDTLIYDCRDKRLTRGAVGFRCWGAAVRISSIKVIDPDGQILWEGLPGLDAPDK